MLHTHHPKNSHSAHGYRHVERSRLKICLLITGLMMIGEFVGGYLTNSLALISDGAHMFTHFFALGTSYLALVWAARKRSSVRTYGFYRLEILAALFNSVSLFIITGYICYYSVLRFISPQPILEFEMSAVAFLGLLVNLATAYILSCSHSHDLNIKSAFFHMLADTLSSVAVIIGAFIIYLTKWYVIDPILSIFISVIIGIWAWGLLTESLNVLLETTPKGLDADEVKKKLMAEIPAIKDIPDMHIWTITSQLYSLTAHIIIDDMTIKSAEELLKKINAHLDKTYDIQHTTIQFQSQSIGQYQN